MLQIDTLLQNSSLHGYQLQDKRNAYEVQKLVNKTVCDQIHTQRGKQCSL